MIDLKALDALISSLSELADESRDVGLAETAVLAEYLAARGRVLRVYPRRMTADGRAALQSRWRTYFDDVRQTLSASASETSHNRRAAEADAA